MTKELTLKTAPHKKWLEELTLELRLNDFSGKAIGDVLATVEEFLTDSKQTAEEAFGKPREYAAQLTAESPIPAKQSLGGAVALSAASLVAFLIFSAALTPWPKGELLLLGAIQLACFGALTALVLALPLYLPYLIRHLWALVAIPLIGGSVGVLTAILKPDTTDNVLLALPPGPVLLVSTAVLITLAVFGTVISLRTDVDAITQPLDPAQSSPTLKSRWFEILTQWLFPILAAFLLGLTALINSGI